MTVKAKEEISPKGGLSPSAGRILTFMKMREHAKSPFRATPGSAGADLCACLEADLLIKSGERVLVPLGVAVEIPHGYGGFLFARSSLGKSSLALANAVGVIDSDYRGEISALLINNGSADYTIKDGDRLVQLVIMPVETADFVEAAALSYTERGSGGFGSTN